MKNSNNGDSSAPSKSFAPQKQKIAIIAGSVMFVSAMLYFTYSNSEQQSNELNPPVLNHSHVETVDKNEHISDSPAQPLQPPESTHKTGGDFVTEFLKKSKNSAFSGNFHGLIGDPLIKDTIQYPSVTLSGKLTHSPLEIELPISSSLLEGFPFTTFGNSTLNVINPLNTPLVGKLIFHDDSDQMNYAVRHFYIAPNSQFTLTGLLDGQYQVAGLSTEMSEFAFITQVFNVYERVEFGNNIELLGKQINPNDIF